MKPSPPIVIRLQDGGSLILNGKIDRVDLLDANGTRYVKIIDYKSGNKTFHFQDIYYGLQFTASGLSGCVFEVL